MTRPHDRSANVADILTHLAEQSSAKLAYRFLLDGESDEKQLTYAELAYQAGRVASILRAVPTYPPDPFRMERTFPRFQAIVNDSKPTAILSTSAILDLAGDLFDEFPEFTGISRFATDTPLADAIGAWRPPDIKGNTLAFLQYTSGSTA